jgi:predicted dehydrogenase
MTIRMGIIGLGRGTFAHNVMQHRSDVEIAAVCDLQEDVARGFAERNGIPQWFTDYQKMLASDIDAVCVATPPQLHAKVSIEALQAGKHVLSEVPACWSIEDGKALVQAVRAAPTCKYMFAENMNYMAICQTYEKMVRDGRLGTIIYAEAEYIHDCVSLMAGRFDGVTEGSATGPTWRATLPPIHYCTHSLGPVLAMMQERCTLAVGMHPGANCHPEHGSIDMEVGLFHTTSGKVVKVLCGFSMVREPAFHYFSIYGTKGVLETGRCGWDGPKAYLTDIPNLHDMIRLPLDYNHTNVPPESMAGGHGSSEWFMCEDFVRAILDDTTPAIDVFFGLDMTLPGICAHISAENGSEPVVVPDPREW